jgi:nicotinamidase-related amidase
MVIKPSWNATTDTALVPFLRAAGVDTVLVAGLITSVCVQHSAFGCFEVAMVVAC